jgi:hypothetical protein
MAIYAPNSPAENQAFWESLLLRWTTCNLPKPDLFLGDFNLVEDAIDRLPCHSDHNGATQALQDVKSTLHLIDGWRRTNPTSKAYTYQQKETGSQSRIDRIYCMSLKILSISAMTGKLNQQASTQTTN